MTLTLLTAYNAPYLAALTFVLLTGIAELIALLCGHSLSSAMDTPDLPEGLTGEALDWLNIGRIPLLIVLCMLAGFFGISGILLQGLIIHLLQAPAPNILLAPLCLLLTCPLVHRTGRLIAPWLPRDETTALTEEAFIGCMATITGYHAVAGSPCEGRFTDRFGQVHYLLLEPEAGKEFRRGDKVIIVCRLSGSRWLGELNPWPDVLQSRHIQRFSLCLIFRDGCLPL